MKIELRRKEVRFLYGLVIAADLLFLFANTPWMSLPIVEGQPAKLTSLFDFVKYQLDLKIEQNVATWYSSVLLLAAAAAAALNFRRSAASRFKWIERAGWGGLCVLLIALSADETATIHETLARLFNAMNEGTGRSQYRVGAGDWIPILLPFIGAVSVGMAAFFVYLFHKRTRVLFLSGAGVIFWIAAIYAESIEAGMVHLNMSRVAEGFLEESCEILGTTALLFAFTEFFRLSETLSDSPHPHNAQVKQKPRRR